MQSQPYRIFGQVVTTQTQEGVSGLRVVAWDKDWPGITEDVPPELLDDRLGSAITGENGNFLIEFDESRFRDYPGEEGPDIYLELYDNDRLVKSTERAVRQDIGTREIEVHLEVDASRLERESKPAAPQGVMATAGDARVEIRWNEVPGAVSYNVYWSTAPDASPSSETQITDISSPFVHVDLANGTTYYYVVTAVNEAGESDPSRSVSATPEVLKGQVPPLDETVATTVKDQTEFLYTGDDPIQKDVESGAIETRRAGGVRGRVMTRDGEPLADVTVRIRDHPEFGYTTTRSDGMFDMAINGGGVLTVRYEKDGFVSAQRNITVGWQQFTRVSNVALVRKGAAATTTVDLTKDEPQLARGNLNDDADGERRPTVLFPKDLTAPVENLEVRIAEYTVGPNGPMAMPDRLPPNVAYTYAVDLDAEVDGETAEILAKGSAIARPFAPLGMTQDLTFDIPVVHYVENFLDFPVGGTVPMGYYDYDDAAWIPSDNGRVIAVLGVQDGLAQLDVDGSGTPAEQAALDELGVTVDERRELAGTYEPGQELWRVPVPHFSPWDCNWPFGPPEDARPPNQRPPKPKRPIKDPCANCK